MWSSERRRLLAGLVLGLVLAACGFAPAYGPTGGAMALQERIRVEAPDNRNGYLLRRRLEDRLGRASGPYRLEVTIRAEEQDFGTTSAGFTTRFRLVGTAGYRLRDATGTVIDAGQVEEFVGYSATGSIVSTPAAQADAQERLTTILADRIVEELIFMSDRLPPAT
ncbi:LPS assembly lipoprotein LptE [Roseivivax sp. GX 12232]|uniref:LPS assembly lipoprotein LptE n=1 Tax=Roseivivax sp. GX 12232 TaxID=2900547 RepID=UPI001E43BB92|nr:LPS assembly lipoprotein LptE [Roseivivax sp. GX 12232]MCE0506018.1 LPS assembly lipoprotein LptE [Roseivivax sp. GX 12232]